MEERFYIVSATGERSRFSKFEEAAEHAKFVAKENIDRGRPMKFYVLEAKLSVGPVEPTLQVRALVPNRKKRK